MAHPSRQSLSDKFMAHIHAKNTVTVHSPSQASLSRTAPYLMSRKFKSLAQLDNWDTDPTPAHHTIKLSMRSAIRGHLRRASDEFKICVPQDIAQLVLNFFDVITLNGYDCPTLIFKFFREMAIPAGMAGQDSNREIHKYLCARKDLRAALVRHYLILQMLRHKYLINIEPQIFEGGTLRGRMVSKQRLPADRARAITTMLLEAVEFLHSRGVVHGNLEPANIRFLDETDCSEIKVLFKGDYGVYHTASKVLTGTCTQIILSRRTSNIHSTAKKRRDNYAFDLWSVGTIAFFMISGLDYQRTKDAYLRFKRQGARAHALHKKKLVQKTKQSIANIAGDECLDFINKLMHKEPSERPTATKALQHPWITKGGAGEQEINERPRSQSPVYKRPRFSAK